MMWTANQRLCRRSYAFGCHDNYFYLHILNKFSGSSPKADYFMHGRGNRERRDSVTDDILMERKAHQNRLSSMSVSDAFVKSLQARGLGKKKKLNNFYMPGINVRYSSDKRGGEKVGAGK